MEVINLEDKVWKLCLHIVSDRKNIVEKAIHRFQIARISNTTKPGKNRERFLIKKKKISQQEIFGI